MRIAKSNFKKIIKEEYNRLLNEVTGFGSGFGHKGRGRPKGIESEAAAARAMHRLRSLNVHQIEAVFTPLARWWLEYFGDPQEEAIGNILTTIDETGRDIYEWAGLPQTEGLTDNEKKLKARAVYVLNWWGNLFPQGRDTSEETYLRGSPEFLRKTIPYMTTPTQWNLDQQALAANLAIEVLGGGLTTVQLRAARAAAKAIAAAPRANLNSIVNAASSGAKEKGWRGPSKGVLFKRAQDLRKQKGLPPRKLPDVKPQQFDPPAAARARKAKAGKDLGQTISYHTRGGHAPRSRSFIPEARQTTLTTPDGSTVKLVGNTMIGGGHTYQIVELADGRRIAFYRSSGTASSQRRLKGETGTWGGMSPMDQWNPVGAVGELHVALKRGYEPHYWLSKLPPTHPESAMNLRTGARQGKVAAADSPMGQAAQALDGYFRTTNPRMRAQWAHVDDWSKLDISEAYKNIMDEFHTHGAYKPWHLQQKKAVELEYQPAGHTRRRRPYFEHKPRGWTHYEIYEPKYPKAPKSYPWDVDPRIVTKHKQTMMIDNKPVTTAGNPIPTTQPIDLRGPRPGQVSTPPQLPLKRKVPKTTKRKLPSTQLPSSRLPETYWQRMHKKK